MAQALKCDDEEVFNSVMLNVGHTCVKTLATSSTESAATITPTITQLHMVELLRRAWGIKSTASLSSSMPAGPGATATALPSRQLLAALTGGQSTATDGPTSDAGQSSLTNQLLVSCVSGSDCRLLDTLLALQGCAAQAIGR